MRSLGIVRRLVDCYYCGRPVSKYRGRAEVCGYCSDLAVKDPLVAKVRLPLSEAERIEAQGVSADITALIEDAKERGGSMPCTRATRP